MSTIEMQHVREAVFGRGKESFSVRCFGFAWRMLVVCWVCLMTILIWSSMSLEILLPVMRGTGLLLGTRLLQTCVHLQHGMRIAGAPWYLCGHCAGHLWSTWSAWSTRLPGRSMRGSRA